MSAPLRMWLAEPLPGDVRRALERLAEIEGVAHVAVMPDVHLAHDVCVGTAVATRDRFFPAAVGGDLGCGMAAVRFSLAADCLRDPAQAAAILRGFAARIPALCHRGGSEPPLPEGLEAAPLSTPALQGLRDREGRRELGTLGRGNHFVELQADDAGWLWLMLHSGSRALGPAIRDHHLRAAQPGMLAWLPSDSDEGRAYLADLEWALSYAEANRRALLAQAAEVVGQVLGASLEPETLRTCQHNHLRSESHFGETWWVHRKGAIPAAAGMAGLIPGSMGTPSFHVEGRGEPESLGSSSHGAGRRFSRSEARGQISARDLERELGGVWFDHRLANALREEAPGAYKDVQAVMRAQRELTKIVRRLRPVLAYKGG